jgi:hypothetical protein
MLKLLANMVLVLVPHVGSKAVELAKHKSVKKAKDKQLDAVVTAVAASVTAGGMAALRWPFANRKNRRLAVKMALQIGGTYSEEVIIAGDWYRVVWAQDETPFEVYPPLPEGIEPLAECRELKNFQGIRIDPSADSS